MDRQLGPRIRGTPHPELGSHPRGFTLTATHSPTLHPFPLSPHRLPLLPTSKTLLFPGTSGSGG